MRPAQSHFVGWENADQGLGKVCACVKTTFVWLQICISMQNSTQVFVGHSLSLEVEQTKEIMICILCERINSDMQKKTPMSLSFGLESRELIGLCSWLFKEDTR